MGFYVKPRMNSVEHTMETGEKITQLENEIKVLKNEVQAVLLDIRENVLAAENPFSASKPSPVGQQVIIDRQVHPSSPLPVNEPKSMTTFAGVSPAQKEKNVDETNTHKKIANETMKIDDKSNGVKPTETHEMEPNHNDKETIRTSPEGLKQADQLEVDHLRLGVGGKVADKRRSDLAAYAGLASWVEDSTRHLGRERTQALLEISEVAGFLPSDVKNILTKLTTIDSNENSVKPTVRDYFNALAKVAALFGNDNDYNTALLLVLSQGDVVG
jgi:hypothetical protein